MKIFKNFIKIILPAAILSLVLFLNISLVAAQTVTPTAGAQTTGLGLIKSPQQLNNQDTALVKNSGFDTNVTVGQVVAAIIQIALGVLGLIFLALLIVGGYQWMTAGGNEEQVSKAQKRIVDAVIGLIIVLAAYAITVFVFNNIPATSKGITTGGGSGTSITNQ